MVRAFVGNAVQAFAPMFSLAGLSQAGISRRAATFHPPGAPTSPPVSNRPPPTRFRRLSAFLDVGGCTWLQLGSLSAS